MGLGFGVLIGVAVAAVAVVVDVVVVVVVAVVVVVVVADVEFVVSRFAKISDKIGSNVGSIGADRLEMKCCATPIPGNVTASLPLPILMEVWGRAFCTMAGTLK